MSSDAEQLRTAEPAESALFRQCFDYQEPRSANLLTSVKPEAGQLRSEPDAEFLGGGERLESAGHDLARARAVRFVGELGLEQLRVGQNDPQLIVQAVKEKAEFGRFVH